MGNKTINKINGGIAIYYGISCAIGGVSTLAGLGFWLFKVFTSQTNFNWSTLIGLSIITAVLGVMGYSIVRVGQEEIDK